MKMSFNVEIPDWVNWVAQDENGDWYGYEVEPKAGPDDWRDSGCMLIQLALGSIPKDFTKELYEIIR